MSFFLSRSFLYSVSTALIFWLAFPGGGEVWPAIFVALLPLLHIANKEKIKISFLGGFCCGMVHYVLLLYWLVTVVGKYGGLPLLIAIPGLLLLAAYMSFYLALFTSACSYLGRKFSPLSMVLVGPILWVGIDWFRGVFLTGFPWMDLGYVLYKVPLLIQVADLFGHHGITFLIVFINCAIFYIIRAWSMSFKLTPVVLLATVVLGSAAGYSVVQLKTVGGLIANAESEIGNSKMATIGVVQGNIDQSVKWSPLLQKDTVEKYLSLTDELAAGQNLELVVWPETALPFYPTSSEHTETLKKYTQKTGLPILTGAPWFEIPGPSIREIHLFNSAFLLQPNGFLGGKYYKTHLVPFGEYVPMRDILFFLAPLVETVGNFRAGKVDKPLVWKEIKAGVLICYESVFPDLSRQWVEAGANVLVNLTNDAWYGKSSAPYHSLAMSVLRAVETRRSVIRSANTGVSAFISPDGSILSRSEIFVPFTEAKDMVLLENVTLWVRFGYMFGPFCMIAAVCLVVAAKIMGPQGQYRR